MTTCWTTIIIGSDEKNGDHGITLHMPSDCCLLPGSGDVSMLDRCKHDKACQAMELWKVLSSLLLARLGSMSFPSLADVFLSPPCCLLGQQAVVGEDSNNYDGLEVSIYSGKVALCLLECTMEKGAKYAFAPRSPTTYITTHPNHSPACYNRPTET